MPHGWLIAIFRLNASRLIFEQNVVGIAGFKQDATVCRRTASAAAPMPLMEPSPKSEMPSFKFKSHILCLIANGNECLQDTNSISNGRPAIV